MSARKNSQGFTLVEILIVVVILGILAAIVIPQFTNASLSARASSVQSQLQTIRSQLELFQNQHNGTYPTLDSTWAILTNPSGPNDTGPAAGSGTDFIPYLQQPPINAFQSSSSIGSAAGVGVGWVYTSTNGFIMAVVPAATAAACALDTTNDVLTY